MVVQGDDLAEASRMGNNPDASARDPHKPEAQARGPAEDCRREWVLAALDKFEARLLRYAKRLLADADQARDVVQFVFLRLCDQSAEKIGDRLAQWLYTV